MCGALDATSCSTFHLQIHKKNVDKYMTVMISLKNHEFATYFVSSELIINRLSTVLSGRKSRPLYAEVMLTSYGISHHAVVFQQ